MEKYSHKTKTKKQTIFEHLQNTANLSEKFAFDDIKSLARAVGLYHDIGMYADAFQEHLLNDVQNHYEHAICGAIECINAIKQNSTTEYFNAVMMAYCLAGSHTGLPDGGSDADTIFDTTLKGRLKRKDRFNKSWDYSSYKEDVKVSIPKTQKMLSAVKQQTDAEDGVELFAFFTRYLYSCLTDAGITDTARFCGTAIENKLHANFRGMLKHLNDVLVDLPTDTDVRMMRRNMQQQAIENARNSKTKVNIINAPTGSGKTLCSLQIALERIINDPAKERIIYVVPHDSLVGYTAKTFEFLFAGYTDILQHHTDYINGTDTEERVLTYASENWDAPFIVTTDIQFFQTLYHYRSNELRKMHNLANSIVIFDEIHTMDLQYLQPCMRGIKYLTEYLNTEVLLLTATAPDYDYILTDFMSDLPMTKLITNREHFEVFNTCDYVKLNVCTYDNVVRSVQLYDKALIVVNDPSNAEYVYKQLTGNKYYLAANMTLQDINEVIKAVKYDLMNNVSVYVVTTPIIEIGGDFDFEVVFREMSGLDSIIQCGGRCNREGKLRKGTVYIFDTEEGVQGKQQVAVNVTRRLLAMYEDITSESCVGEYFATLFDVRDSAIVKNNLVQFSEKHNVRIDSLPFRSYAKHFLCIRDNLVGVVVENTGECTELLNAVEQGDILARRKLQKYTIPVKENLVKQALACGKIEERVKGIYVLLEKDLYSSITGLQYNNI